MVRGDSARIHPLILKQLRRTSSHNSSIITSSSNSNRIRQSSKTIQDKLQILWARRENIITRRRTIGLQTSTSAASKEEVDQLVELLTVNLVEDRPILFQRSAIRSESVQNLKVRIKKTAAKEANKAIPNALGRAQEDRQTLAEFPRQLPVQTSQLLILREPSHRWAMIKVV